MLSLCERDLDCLQSIEFNTQHISPAQPSLINIFILICLFVLVLIKSRKELRRWLRKRNPQKSGGTSSFKSLIATGVRTLTSFIPGQAIVKPAVDFLLKTFGFIKFFLTESGDLDGTVMISGAATVIPFYIGDLFSELNLIGLPKYVEVPVIGIDGNAVKDKVKVIGTEVNHKSIQVLHVNFKVVPTGEYGKRCGMWAMAWQPNHTSYEDTAFNIPSLNGRPPSFDCVREMTFSRCGPATRSLSLNWKPKVARDGHAALPKPLAGYGNYPATGWLYISYEDANRPTNKVFSIDELSFEVIVRATGRFGSKELNSLTNVGSQILQPTQYVAQDLRMTVLDGLEDHEFEFSASNDGNLKFSIPKTERYIKLRDKLCADALNEMTI